MKIEINETIIWYDFTKIKPIKSGAYLIAYNNWRATGPSGIPSHHYESLSANWDKDSFSLAGYSLNYPDQWAYLPMPPKADKPDNYEGLVDKIKEERRQHLLNQLKELDSEGSKP